MAVETSFPVKKLVNLTAEQGARIADYRFKHRLKSENEAIRLLIERGLAHDLASPAKGRDADPATS